MSTITRPTAPFRLLVLIAFVIALLALVHWMNRVFAADSPEEIASPAVFINEIHYDNDGTDTGEFIEIAGPAGVDVTGWRIVRYNGSGGSIYTTTSANEVLSGTIPLLNNGFGVLVITYPTNGLQNGGDTLHPSIPDGIALIDANSHVVQFLSYEGSFTAIDGAAAGQTSTDIGVRETGSTPAGYSLQLTGTGCTYADFEWVGPLDDTPGEINTGQIFDCTPTPTPTDTSTATPTETATSTETPIPSPTITETATETATSTETMTPTATDTSTPTETATSTEIPAETATPTATIYIEL